jgi:MEMO1 family protein
MSVAERVVYATQPNPLRKQIETLLQKANPQQVEGDVLAIVVPDSNLLSGGEAAADVFKTLEGRQFDTVVVIAPSHAGSFSRINICSVDHYRTPLGELRVSDAMRNELCDEDDDIFLDDRGHYHTEGVDVQLPFLQVILSGFDIVPVVMGDESPEFCRELGLAVGEIMYNRRLLVVATADILKASEEDLLSLKTHFEAGDVSRLVALLNSEEVHVEGKGPLLVALIAAMHRRANTLKVVRLDPPNSDRPGCFGAILSRA